MSVHHLESLCDHLLRGTEGSDKFNSVKQILAELERLNALDFEPDKRGEFLIVKGKFDRLVHPKGHETPTGEKVNAALDSLKKVLAYYAGHGSHLEGKPFTFLSDPELIEIIKRDYRELYLRLHPSGSWKSTVVLAGSILEAILFDILASPRFASSADSAARALPRYSGMGPIAQMRWTLEALIDVSVTLGIIRRTESNLIHQTLRDFRNYIHPSKEKRKGLALTENEAGIAIHSLNLMIDHFQSTITP